MKVIFNDNQKTKTEKLRAKISKKSIIVIGICIIIVSIAIIILCYSYSMTKENGYASKEELVAAVITATYENDFTTVMNAMPKEFKEKLEEKAVAYYEASYDRPESITKSYSSKFEKYAANLDAFYGKSDVEEMWSMRYEITDYYTYSDEELKTVRQMLNMAGIYREYEIDEYGVISIRVSIIPTYEHKEIKKYDIHLPILCHNGAWFLAQNYGAYTEEKMASFSTDLYGSLLDGFIIDGTLDQYGYKILDTENGTQVRWDPEYESYTYTDMYGNIHLCTDKLKDTKVIGPDGGDPIDEEAYNQQIEEYYENLDDPHNSNHLDSHSHVLDTISGNTVR